MREIKELKEIQDLALSMLKLINQYCTEYNLEYYLGYGSLLGAVRHGGFIPWDDDIDIWIKREDYTSFVDGFNQWGKYHGLYVNSANTTIGYNRPHAQVCLASTVLEEKDRNNSFSEGYFVDVFPIDGLPQNKVSRWIRITHLQMLKNICTLSAIDVPSTTNKTKKQKIISFLSVVFRKINTRKLMLKYEKIAQKSSCRNSKLIQIIAPPNHSGRNMIMEGRLFDSSKKVIFEDMESFIPVGYKEILEQMYGDYLTLPPIDSQKPHHNFRLYMNT